jgi:hypothetical protein
MRYAVFVAVLCGMAVAAVTAGTIYLAPQAVCGDSPQPWIAASFGPPCVGRP